MAGSIKSHVYTDDRGQQYVINMDESNGEAVGNVDLTGGAINPAVILPGIPQGLEPRYASYQSDDGRVRRAIVVTTQAALAALPTLIPAFFPTNATTITTLSLSLVGIVNEVVKAYSGVDTGLNDGDNT